MFCNTKHSFLQLEIGYIHPKVLDKAIISAKTQLFPSKNNNFSTDSTFSNTVENLDFTQIAYGKWALPKLLKELYHHDVLIRIKALKDIEDLIHDQEKIYEALKLNLIKRLVNLMLHKNSRIREQICTIFTIVAQNDKGREAIISEKIILINFLYLIEDHVKDVRFKAAKCVEIISLFWQCADILIENTYIPILLNCLLKHETEIILIHLKTLYNLMYAEGKIQVYIYDGIATMMNLLETNNNSELVSRCISNIARVLSHYEAKQYSVKCELLNRLLDFIDDPRENVHTAAVEALMFATHLTEAKKQAAKIKCLVPIIICLSYNQNKPACQLYSIKILTNLCEHPEIRKKLLEKYFETIKSIPVSKLNKRLSEEIQKNLHILIELIQWKP